MIYTRKVTVYLTAENDEYSGNDISYAVFDMFYDNFNGEDFAVSVEPCEFEYPVVKEVLL